MESHHQQWIHRAIELAVANVQSGHGGPFGAVVVKNGEIVGSGVNAVTAMHDPTAHAEMTAIREACRKLQSFQLDGCELYTSCEPCPMCLGAIYWARPREYYFACTRESAAEAGFQDAYIYEEIHRKPEQRSIPGHCLISERRLAPFVEWAQSIHKIRY